MIGQRILFQPEQRRSGRRLRPPRPLVATRLGQSQAVRVSPGRSFRSIRTAGISGARPAIRARRAARNARSSRDLHAGGNHHAILRDGAAAGARSATVYAAGFGEGGDPEGRKRGAQLREAIARTGIAVVGPNCMGVACGASKFSTVPDETLQEPVPGPVAVVVQSGAMATSINRAINDLGLKTAYLASCGSQFGCRIADFIDYFADEPELRVILCYIEGIPDAVHFLEAARRARAQRQDRRRGEDRRAPRPRAPRRWRIPARSPAARKRSKRSPAAPASSASDSSRTPSRRSSSWRASRLPQGPQHRGDDELRRAAQPDHRSRRAHRRDARHIVGRHRSGAGRGPRAPGRLQSARHQPHHPGQAIRRLPRHPGRRARGRHRAGRRRAAARPERRPAARQSPVDRRRRAPRAERWTRPSPCSRRCWSSPTDYGRAVRAQMPHVPMLRGTERALRIVNTLARAAARPLHAGAFVAPPADTELARRWRARAAALDRPTALNEVEFEGAAARLRHSAAAGAAGPDAPTKR